MPVTTRTVWASERDTRLDRWFHRHYPQLTQGALQKMLRTGQIRVDGKRVEANTRLLGGQQVRIPPMPEGPAPKADPKPVNEHDAAELQRLVIYRDDHVIAIDKPQGLPVQGGPGIVKHVDGLLDALRFGSEERPAWCIGWTATRPACWCWRAPPPPPPRSRAPSAARDAQKTYWAVVVGRPHPLEGRIDMALAKQGARAASAPCRPMRATRRARSRCIA